MAKQKYYVVWVGRSTGIFTDWASTKASVNGFPGAKYKGYNTMAEAEIAYGSASAALSATAGAAKVATPVPSRSNPVKRSIVREFVFDPAFDIYIFCDGVRLRNPNETGAGVAVYQQGELIELHYGLYEPVGTSYRAELSALHRALLIAEGRLKEGLKVKVLSDSSDSIKTMNKFAGPWERAGWLKLDGTVPADLELVKEMFALFSSIRKRIKLEHVSAHVGIEGNELADRLSLLAIKDKESGFVAYDGLDKVDEMLAR